MSGNTGFYDLGLNKGSELNTLKPKKGEDLEFQFYEPDYLA